MGSSSCWHPGQKPLWDLPILRRWQPMLPWPIRTFDLSCLCSRRGDSGTSGMNWCVVRPLLECSHLACHMSQVLISSYCLMCRREIKSLLEMRSSMKGAEFIYLFFSFTLPSQFFFYNSFCKRVSVIYSPANGNGPIFFFRSLFIVLIFCVLVRREISFHFLL
jgi:hypothetical protein